MLNLPDRKGLGTVIWEPTANNNHQALFDNGGDVIPVRMALYDQFFEAYRQKRRGSSINNEKQMTAISIDVVARAVQTVTGYDLAQTEALCDRIHVAQPHVFLTTLALSQDGVSMPKMDHVLHVLMVVHIAIEMQTSRPLGTISRNDIQVAHKKHQDMLNYLEAEPDKRMWDLTCTAYPEPVLLAYVLDFLSEKGIVTETNEDYLVATMSKVILDVYVDALRESEQGKCQPFRKKTL